MLTVQMASGRRVRLVPWAEVRARMLAEMTPAQRARWERELKKARDRYRSEIRKYRGIDKIRQAYRRRNR